MCGIVALFSDRDPISHNVIVSALDTLHHRGPDGRQHWISPTGEAGLGHARLSIIDLENGTQPLHSEDNQVHVVVNGEFYDFERIRQDLESRGHRFRTCSDSEIVLHLYEEYGVHCVHHLRGEFAFVLWDQRQRRMIAVRDRFGIKPLFYAQIGSTTVFASEAKALFAAGLPAQWDREQFIPRALTTWYAPDRSVFNGVHQVPPGHHMILSQGNRRTTRYWDFDYPIDAGDASSKNNQGEYIEQLRSVLDQAVRLRLRADVPVACYLSGGLDSCTILGLAARHATTPVRAFTLSFSDPAYDEQAIAREMADKANAQFTPISVTANDIADDFSKAIWHAEQPFANAHGVAKYTLSRAVKNAGYRVVLTGEGSDEILAGYPHFRRDMLLYNRQGQAPEIIEQLLKDLNDGNAVSKKIMLPEGDSLSLGSIRSVLGYVPSWMEACSTVGFALLPFIAKDFVSQSSNHDYFFGLLDSIDVQGQLHGRAPVNQSSYLWSKTMLPNYILSMLGDRMEMGNSVEGRIPFLDHHVVEAVCKMPVSIKINGMTEKYVLREAAKPFITSTVYQRQKHPFLAPPATFEDNTRLCDLMQSVLRGSAFQRVPFYDHKKILGLLDHLPKLPPAQRNRVDPLLISIMSTSLLAEQFGL